MCLFVLLRRTERMRCALTNNTRTSAPPAKVKCVCVCASHARENVKHLIKACTRKLFAVQLRDAVPNFATAARHYASLLIYSHVPTQAQAADRQTHPCRAVSVNYTFE